MTKYASSVVVIVTLAAVTALGWTGNLSSTNVLAALTGLLAGVGGLGALIIGPTQPNSVALPHALIGALIIGALTVLGIHGTLSADQLATVFSGVIVGGAVVAGNVTAPSSSPGSTGQVN